MRIEYELKFLDYLLFNIMHQFFSIPTQIVFFAPSVFILAISINGKNLYASVITTAVIVYIAMWIFQLLFSVAFLYSQKNKSLLTKHIVELQNEAFYEETSFGRSYHYWTGIVKIVDRPKFVAVYINAQAAHIIPNRAFSSPEQRTKFVMTVREKLNAV